MRPTQRMPRLFGPFENFEVLLHLLHFFGFPRHPVIPAEVRCLIGMFLGSKYQTSGGGVALDV